MHAKSGCGRLGLLVALATLAGCRAGEPWRIERSGLIDRYLESTPPGPLIVVDIDDTVVESSLWSDLRLFFNLFYASKAPFEGAPEALGELHSSWNLILVTARDDQFAARTLRWLDAQGFPETPVVFSSCLLPSAASRAEYKTMVLDHLRERGLSIAVGIGDKASDVAAYLANDARAILILDGPSDDDLDATLAELKVETLFGGASAPLELVVMSTEGAWRRIVEHLQRK